MPSLIIFRCPYTGMDVQTSLQKLENDDARGYEVFACPACTRIHLIHPVTGKVAGEKQ